MFGDLLGKFVDKEKIVKDYLQDVLEQLSEELGCGIKDFFIMIHPADENFNAVCHVMKFNEKRVPQLIRELTIKEIVGGTEEE